MEKRLFAAVMYSSFGASVDDFIDNAMGRDTSASRKAKKERARMLSLARQEELRKNPKPPKKERGKKRK